MANDISRRFCGFIDIYFNYNFKLRELIIDAIPADLKFAISGGIGLFIAFLGLSQGGLIVANDATLVGLGPLNVGSTWVTIVGLVVTAILLVRRVPGGIFIGMAISTIVGLATGVIQCLIRLFQARQV